MGSIQSGKTANMIGVAAKGLDRGFRIVIVLGGLKMTYAVKPQIALVETSYAGESIVKDNVKLGSNHPLGNGKHGPRKDCWSPSVYGDVNHQASRVRRKPPY